MDYTEAIEYIHGTPKFARVLGNSLLQRLLGKLGNPQKELKFIHIAGTNGKGSAAIMLSEVLSRSGFKTGLFISPYIERFNERIKINGTDIGDDELAAAATRVRDAIEKYDAPVSEFALDTAVAFEYFRNNRCDIVILEVGLGGRLDATNVIDESLVSVIMSIGLDHMQYLGESIAEIAAEKCGIIKCGGRAVTYPVQADEAMGVIENACAEAGAELTVAKIPEVLEDGRFEYNGKEYEISLSGKFQCYNAAVAICVVDKLREIGYKIPEGALRSGLKNAANPARLEKMPCGLYIDGAHNLPAAKALCHELARLNKPVVLCVAMMEDKDIEGCAAELARLKPRVVATRTAMPRCASAELICAEFKKHGIEAEAEEEPIRAAERALEMAGDNGLACVCGSLYLAGEVRKSFAGRKYYVYILRCSDGSLYTGIATDVKRRFDEHRSGTGRGAKYTRSHMPVSVEAVYGPFNRAEASKREYSIKKLTKEKKEELIKNSAG